MVSNGKKDSRLTDFDWNGRKAAPVERLVDLHAHYRGDPAQAESLAAQLDAYHVEYVNIIAVSAADAQWIKEASVCGKIGERVIPYAWVDLAEPKAEQIDRAYDMGFWGLKFIAPRYAYDDRAYDGILARAQERGMPCLFHTGVLGGTAYKWRMGTGMSLMRADMLDTLASRYPELLIQGAHLGNPALATAFRVSRYSPNVIWDCSGGIRHMLLADPRILHAGMRGLPTAWGCMAWATDTTTGVFSPDVADGWPNQYEYQLAFWQRILASLPDPPTPEQLDKFFWRNGLDWIERVKAKRQR